MDTIWMRAFLMFCLAALLAGCLQFRGGAGSPQEAVLRTMGDLQNGGFTSSRVFGLDGNRALVVFARTAGTDQREIHYGLAERGSMGWNSIEAGGFSMAGPVGGFAVQTEEEPVIAAITLPYAPPPEAFLSGVLLDNRVRSVEIVFPGDVSRQDSPQQGLFLFIFDPFSPPCQLVLLDGNGKSLHTLDLVSPTTPVNIPSELLPRFQEQCQ